MYLHMIVREHRCPTLTVHEIAGGPVVYEPHVDLNAQFSIALEGVLTDRGHDYDIERQPGSVTFRPAGTEHAVFSSGPARGLCIDIPADRFEPLRAHAGLDAANAVHILGNDLSGIADEIYFELRRGDHERPLMLEALTVTLIARFAALLRRRNAQGRPAWLDDALEVIRAGGRRGLSPGRLATYLGVATADLNTALVLFERASLHELVERSRVEWARAQLRASRRAIAAIAHEAGFYDNSHMVRAFRRILGTTPSAYRRAYGRDALSAGPPASSRPAQTPP